MNDRARQLAALFAQVHYGDGDELGEAARELHSLLNQQSEVSTVDEFEKQLLNMNLRPIIISKEEAETIKTKLINNNGMEISI